MIKKIIALAAGALLSLNASAAYIAYTFNGASIADTSLQTSNMMVIRDEDKSVAFFSIYTNLGHFSPQDRGDAFHRNWLIETTTSFTGLGPTNMYMRDDTLEAESNQMWLLFSDGSAPGAYNYTMRIHSDPDAQFPYPQLFTVRDVTYTGTVTEIPVSAALADYLDTNNDYVLPRDIPYYDPTQVPEPASLALLMVGALGAFGASRRRNAGR